MKLKNCLYIVVLLLFAIPLLQSVFSFTKDAKQLYGEYDYPNIDFLPQKWDFGEYQTTKETYLTQHFGFRNAIIRAHNELEYKLIGKMNRIGGVLGKEDYLFDQAYIDEYCGIKFMGEKAIQEQMNKLAALKDSLAKRNILLMVVFAPSKAHFCAEYLPTRFAQKGKNTHYDYFTKACQARNIAHIDFNQHFLKLKSKSPYPLFTKTGIHWSAYGAALAMDSIFKRMEQEKKVDMPDFDWQDMELSDTPRGTDDDVMNLANMYTTFKNPTLAYPKFKFNYKLGQQKLKTLTIGDSFWWDIYRSGANENMFEKAEYWCLFKDVFPEKAPSTIAQYGIRSEMESYDVIVIEATGLNLYRFGFGFIEKAYESYLHPKAADFVSLDFEQKVAACKISMRNNPEWLYNLTQRAAESHISLDSIMQRDAIYTVKQAVK